MAGYISRRFTCRPAVTHPSSNRAQCRLTALIELNALTTTLRCHQYISSSSSSSCTCSMPIQERCCFHDITPLFPVISSVPGRPQPQILLFEVVLDGTQPCLTRTTTRASPLLRWVIDASVEGTCMVLYELLEPPIILNLTKSKIM